MQIIIDDDFDMEKIAQSGQCFRVRHMDDSSWRFITGDNVVYIRDEGDHQFSVSCGKKDWEDIWFPYFDLGRNYSGIYVSEREKNGFTRKAMDYSRGLRVLRQDPWETLITFIISQRKNIPAISSAVETLAARYGHRIETGRETLCSFPSPEELSNADEAALRECSLGYRAPYIADAVRRVADGESDLDAISSLNDEDLLTELQKIRGVGKKVANCVALFAYSRTGCVPVDVWISRAINEDCNGESPFPEFGENAGIIQQYVFYYERNGKTQPDAASREDL